MQAALYHPELRLLHQPARLWRRRRLHHQPRAAPGVRLAARPPGARRVGGARAAAAVSHPGVRRRQRRAGRAAVGFLRGSGVADVVYTHRRAQPIAARGAAAATGGPAFRWEGADEPAHFIIANEVADALPVHRVDRARRAAARAARRLDDATLALGRAARAAPAARRLLRGAALLPPEGEVVGRLPRAGRLGQRARAATRARVWRWSIDYAASPPRDSLLTYYRHTLGSDPLVRLGSRTSRSHVDLRTLVRLAHRRGPAGRRDRPARPAAQPGLRAGPGAADGHDRPRGARRTWSTRTGWRPDRGRVPAARPAGRLQARRRASAATGPSPTTCPSLPPDAGRSRLSRASGSEAFGGDRASGQPNR